MALLARVLWQKCSALATLTNHFSSGPQKIWTWIFDPIQWSKVQILHRDLNSNSKSKIFWIFGFLSNLKIQSTQLCFLFACSQQWIILMWSKMYHYISQGPWPFTKACYTPNKTEDITCSLCKRISRSIYVYLRKGACQMSLNLCPNPGGRTRADLGHTFLKILFLIFWHLLMQNLMLITKMTLVFWFGYSRRHGKHFKFQLLNWLHQRRVSKKKIPGYLGSLAGRQPGCCGNQFDSRNFKHTSGCFRDSKSRK